MNQKESGRNFVAWPSAEKEAVQEGKGLLQSGPWAHLPSCHHVQHRVSPLLDSALIMPLLLLQVKVLWNLPFFSWSSKQRCGKARVAVALFICPLQTHKMTGKEGLQRTEYQSDIYPSLWACLGFSIISGVRFGHQMPSDWRMRSVFKSAEGWLTSYWNGVLCLNDTCGVGQLANTKLDAAKSPLPQLCKTGHGVLSTAQGQAPCSGLTEKRSHEQSVSMESLAPHRLFSQESITEAVC